MTIKELLITQIEKLVLELRYDFLYEEEYGQILGQVIQRDSSGSIEKTPLSFQIHINEEKGSGRLIYYQEQGEIKRQEFHIDKPDTLVNVLTFIHEILGSDPISQTK